MLCVVFVAKEMLGELFTPVETPEAPNRGFFKGLFGGGAQSLDREELCKFLVFVIFLVFLLKEASVLEKCITCVNRTSRLQRGK